MKFLQIYFGYTPEKAESFLKIFFLKFSSRFDEDAIHHESSYRMAAIIHYLIEIKGDPNGLGDWMIANRFNQPPADALAYFRENYFDKNRQP